MDDPGRNQDVYDEPEVFGVGEDVPAPKRRPSSSPEDHQEGRQRPGTHGSSTSDGTSSRRGSGHEPVYDPSFSRRRRGDEAVEGGRRRQGFSRRGGGENHGRGRSSGELSEGEEQAGVSDRGRVGQDESNLTEFARDAAMAAEIAGGRFGQAINYLAKRKKKAAGGGIIIGLIGLVIFFFSIVQGPLQVIHLGQVLGKAFSNQDNAANIRERGLMRWFRTGNPGETRVGVLGSKITQRALAKLEAEGITFEVDTGTGHLKGVQVDLSKSSKYGGMDEANARAQIAKDNGISIDKVSKIGGTSDAPIFRVDAADVKINEARGFISSAMDSADFGKVARAVAFRPVADYLGKPGILHPWKRLKSGLADRFFSSGEQKQLIQEEEKQQTSVSEQTPEAKAVVDDVKNDVEGESGVRTAANAALGIQAGLCLAREIADKVPDLNWGTVVMPAASLATFAMAEGSQAQAGDDLSIEQPGAAVANYTNKAGQSIWESLPLQALSGAVNPSGFDLPSEFKQAFDFTSTAAGIVKTLDSYGANYLCSTVAQIGGAIAGVALIATGPGGTITEKLLSGGGQLIAGAVVANAIMKFVPKLIASAAPPVTTLTGPLGGSFAAYGVRAMANMSYTSFGGTVLSSAQSAQLAAVNEQNHEQQLKSESFATRILDPYNSDSLVASIIDRGTMNPMINFSGLISSFSRPLSILGDLSSTFFPKVAAQANTHYDWGSFYQFGISWDDLTNPTYDNPDNADAAAKILDSSKGSDYIDKAEKCFGDKISKGSDGWDVEQDKPVNPSSTEYQEAGCDDSSESWTRIKFLAFDTLLAKGDVCYHGDEDVCKELKLAQDSGGSGTTGTGGGSGTLPTGTSQELAQQLLPFIKSGKLFCGPAAGGSGAADCTDIQNTAKGVPVGGNCAVKAITPHLLGMILGLVRDDGWTLGISAMCSDHHVETDGPYAGHTYGSVADFGVQNGKTGLAAATDQQFVDDAAALLSSVGGSFGQVATGGSVDTSTNCHLAYPSQKGGKFTLFPDTCNHQHIRAAP